MQRFRILASIFIVIAGLVDCTCGRAQDRPKDKQQDQARQADRDASGERQPQRRQDDVQRPRDGVQPQRGRPDRLIGQQKQMERTPELAKSQQLAQREAWQQRRANHWQYEHRTWEQRGGYQGTRIPEGYFRDHYGKDHTFRMYDLPFVYERGNPRFQYEGYWFTMLDPYPENWSGYWYQTDDLFVEYRGGGYYLFNRGFPDQGGVALDVTL